ncbi:MAG: lamin tail domain-containing protein [Deltaproteobacteria bacterium]|nr:lamin tail domain-containing protein [Deltaproteobacteria bacterium]
MSTPRPPLLPAALALLAAACAPTIPKGDDGGADGDDGAGDGAADGAGDGNADGADGADGGGPDPEAPWVRDEDLSPGPVVFTELHVHPPEGDGAEWLELHNPTVLPIDLSGWALVDGVDYRFPEGTLIEPGGYLVVAADPAALGGVAAGPVLGPWAGRLADDGEKVELRSNGGRRIDALRYGVDAPWPVAPGGSGLTLAKARPTDPSARAESWGASAAVGGSPGAANEAPAAEAPLHLSEWGAAGEDWVELEALADVDPADLRLRTDRGRDLPLPAGAVGAGDLLLLDGLDPLEEGELLWLADGASGAVLDAGRVAAAPRARLEPFGPALRPTPPTPGAPNLVELTEDIVIHEIMYHRNPRVEEGLPFEERPEEWIELFNRGEAPVDLGGWRLVDAVGFTFPADTVLAPGGLLVVARDAAALVALHPDAPIIGDWEGSLSNASDQIVLLDANGNTTDQVRYADGGRWPTAADGGGSSLELIDPWADNTAPGAWAASDEAGRAPWTTLRWTAEAAPSAVGPDGVWNELVMGLLDAGEVLVDDVSVIEDPDGEAIQLVRDPGFDRDGDWRTIGNHRRSARVPDPEDPADTVLRLVATGPTEHMHNHAETTLDRPLRGVRTEVSLRARWVSGSNQLHTRLYFNRMPRTHLLPQPATAGTPGAPNSHAGALGPTLVGLRADAAVPAPGEPVTITVQADDPDGISSLAVRWRFDGATTFSSTDMDESAPGIYTATLPGQAAGALVQLYVEAEDASGAISAAPAAGAESRALIQWAEAASGAGALPTLRLLMTAADSAYFHDPVNLMSNEGVGATVVYAEQEVYFDVSVRAKGSQRGRPEVLRLGYGLRFLDDAPFRGVHSTVLLDRSEGVNFGQREVLHNVVAARLGLESAELNDLAWVVAPRPEHTGPVELQLDRFGGLMLDAQFEDGGAGTQWDYELIYFPYTSADGTPEGAKLPQPDAVIGVPVSYLGEDKEAYRWNFAIQNNTAQDEYDELIALGELFSSDDATLLARADELIDVEQWLRAFAFATLSGAVDNYGSDGAQHNARFYLRPADRRLLYFPHDLDFYGHHAMPVVGNGDLARLLTDSLYHRRYYAALDDALRRAYSSAYLAPWCARLAALLPDQDFAGHCAFIDTRADWLRSGPGDAVDSIYPPTPFVITTGDGARVEVTTPTVSIEGRGGVSVRVISEDSTGFSAEPEWTGPTTWALTLPIPTGASTLRLVATDLRGAVLGEDSVEVLRSDP